MAKLAIAPQTATTNPPGARPLAQGPGWTVSDVVCTAGPRDRPFEERHPTVSIAIVASGTFRYRSAAGSELMTPGSVLLGNAGECFECGHEHGTGDRCIAFRYDPGFFERVAADAGARSPHFSVLRVPPIRALSHLIARSQAGLAVPADSPWDELSVQLAAQAIQLTEGLSPQPSPAPPGAAARVALSVRAIASDPARLHSLGTLAAQARLSPFHFLRSFERLTGVTPHQYLLRLRLREAALRLTSRKATRQRILDIALDCGFGDLSNFNRTFRAEFGVTPRAYRLQCR